MFEVNHVSGNGVQNSPVSSVQPAQNSVFSDTVRQKFKIPGNLDAIFEEASKKYNVPSILLKAVGKAESDFRVNAVSHCGAQGVMQLMPATARSLGVTDAFDPYQNIMGGSKYLADMLKKYNGNVKLALAAYNAGSNNVDKYGGIPPFQETQNYVKKIMGYIDGGNDSFVSSPSSDYTLGGAMGKIYGRSYEAAENDQLYAAIIQNMLDFDSFTTDDYLMFLELLKNNMQSSFSDSMEFSDMDGDYERQNFLNTNRLTYRF